MAVHARGGVFSPYRDRGPASLAELVPPDRRRRNAALFGLSCAMIGALMTWSVEALATWDAETLASWDPSPSGWFALRGRAVESPEPTTTLTEPAPAFVTFSALTVLDSRGNPQADVRFDPVALDGQSMLTVISFPACDDVLLDGASTGASPLWQHRIAPGAHRLGLRFGRRVMRFELRAAADEATILKQPGWADGDED